MGLGRGEVTLFQTASMGNVILVLSLIVAAVIVYLAVYHWIPVQVLRLSCSLAMCSLCCTAPPLLLLLFTIRYSFSHCIQFGASLHAK